VVQAGSLRADWQSALSQRQLHRKKAD